MNTQSTSLVPSTSRPHADAGGRTKPSRLHLRLLGRLTAAVAMTALITGFSLATPAQAASTSTLHAKHAGHLRHAHGHKKTLKKHTRKKHHQTKNTSTPSTARARDTGPFVEPTTFEAVSNTCTLIGTNSRLVTVTWKVTGGRYANLGNPQMAPDGAPSLFGNVYDGGAVYVHSHMIVNGWAAPDLSTPIFIDFPFQQVVAPIDHSDDASTWQTILIYPVISISC